MKYKLLKKQVFLSGDYSLIPIRLEDRYDIMRWRNEQVYHLRQKGLLSKEQQDDYFEEVVTKLFDQVKPNQMLFSFLKGDECIGYGGLVHINWIDKNAEISFVMNTSLEKDHFKEYWSCYLKMIEDVAFKQLWFQKIYVYAFDLRPHLYPALEENQFFLDGRLKGHYHFEESYIDVVIYSKLRMDSK